MAAGTPTQRAGTPAAQVPNIWDQHMRPRENSFRAAGQRTTAHSAAAQQLSPGPLPEASSLSGASPGRFLQGPSVQHTFRSRRCGWGPC